ncbi:MAG TPA: hypothetical protein DIT03_13125 [Candidatus Accumulibacter sp.]|nr:MAG: hypothetical protein AW07_04288 [Candidatus Accumulibacter sp. SK-11]HAY29087.1 hypothetical protein [Accumulibacter sp.]HCN69177.1 hypothetical protein [Accumulibacter sp.]HCV12655.1 hypothetical protein [Accumulibacter sp.]
MEHSRPDPIPRRVALLGYGGLLPLLVLASASHFPAWYLPLRFRLTTVGCLCLTAGAFAETA